jgi:hypothetical protein
MAQVMEADKTLDPIAIGAFGAEAVVLQSDDIAYSLQELFRLAGGWGF